MGTVSFSVGGKVTQVRNLRQFTLPFEKFADAVLKPSGIAKDGVYFCAPMAGGFRTTLNAQPVSYLALDFDKLTEQQWATVVMRSRRWSSFVYTTPSHKPPDHRLRVVVELTREVNRDEYRRLYGSASEILGVPGDSSGAKAEQPMYCRRDGTKAKKNLDAPPLNVDTLLASTAPEVDPLAVKPAFLTNAPVVELPAASPGPSAPSYAQEVAVHCAQVRKMRDTLGDVSIDTWRGVIGIIKHSVEGIELAREWTTRRIATGHAQADVDRDFDTWKAGPATCEFFERAAPGGCDGCIHKGKIKTPLVLGRAPAVPVVETVEALVNEEVVQVQVKPLPHGYSWQDGYMVAHYQDKDGVWAVKPFSKAYFYATHHIEQLGGAGALMMRNHLQRDKRIKQFHIESRVIGSTPDLIKALAENFIVMTDNNDASKYLTAYMRASLNKLVAEAKEIEQMGAFGWKQDMSSFLLGDRLYSADGSKTIALVGGGALAYKHAFDQGIGDATGWSEGINELYNREGNQHMQYVLCSAFGSLLSPLASDTMYKGIPCAVTGEDSGKGKSAVCKAALYAFGDAERMTINGDRGSTVNALYMQMSAYNNVPLLIDEVTNIKADRLSDLLYTVSGGRDRGRLMQGKNSGTKAQDVGEWRSSMYLTANTRLLNALAAKQGNTEAEAVRLFEISIDTYGVQMASLEEATVAFKKISKNSGGAGEQYIQYLVQHRGDVDAAMAKMEATVGKAAKLALVSQYRFFRQHVVCTLVAANIMHALGLIKFDLKELTAWALVHLHRLCQEVQMNNTTNATDALGQMLNVLQPFIIQTKDIRDSRTSNFGPETVQKPSGPVVGRVVLSEDRLEISQTAFKKWCSENRQTPEKLLEEATKDGSYIGLKRMVSLTRGTNLPGGRIRVYQFVWSKIEGKDEEA